MFRNALVAAAAFLPLVASPVAQSPAWSDAFGQPGIRGRVFSVHAPESGPMAGELVVGGDLDQVTGGPIADVAWLDGGRWRTVGNGSGILGTARAFADFDGALVVGGELVVADGQPVSGVASWDGSSWQPLGAGLTLSFGTAEVFALEVHDGSLFAAGFFDAAGGVPTRGIARWDGSQWHAVGGGLDSASTALPTGFALHSASDGTLVVGGSFAGAGGVVATGVASWDGSAWSAFGSGTLSGVRAFTEFGGDLIAGGDFNTIGGVAANRVARWDGNSWAPLGGGLLHLSVLSQVFALEVFDGALFASGRFSTAGGVSARHVARWDGTGWAAVGGVSQPAVTTGVLATTTWNGQLVVGGEFEYAGSTTLANDVVSVNVASFDGADWHGLGEGLGSDNEVHAIVPYRGGLVALGRFGEIGALATASVAWFDGVRWRPMPGNFSHTAISGVEYQGDFVAVGEFRSIDGMTVDGVARWDGSQWQAMGSGISAFGARTVAVYQGQLVVGGYGTPKVWNGVDWQPIAGTAVSGLIDAMIVHNGLLYFGGTMNNFSPPNADVFVWDGTTAQPVGGDFDDPVTSLAVHGGRLIAGGYFDQCAGVTCDRLAEWTGTAWVAYANAGFQVGSVESLVIAPDGDLIVGGSLGGANVRRYDGSSWVELSSAMIGAPLGMHYDTDADHLWVGGIFHTVDGVPSANITRYEFRNSWTDGGRGAAATTAFPPALSAQGGLVAGTDVSWTLTAPDSTFRVGVHVLGQAVAATPLFGTTLLPQPDVVVPFLTDAHGQARVRLPLTFTAPPTATVYLQSLVVDPTVPSGVSSSNLVASPR